MRPHDSRPISSRAARVRMFLKAHLGWMTGFPLGQQPEGRIDWIAFESPGATPHERLVLDREHLASACYTVAELRTNFPRALPRVVGDPDRWAARVHAQLDPIGAAIHRGAALPADAFGLDGVFRPAARRVAAALLESQPELRPLAGALSWALWQSPDQIQPALGWLASQAGELRTLLEALGPVDGCVEAVHLWRLSHEDGAMRVAPLLRWLGDPRTHRVPVSGGSAYVHRLTGTDAPEARPRCTAAGPLRRWLAWLPLQERRTRRRSLRLFELIAPDGLLDAWERWWSRLDGLEARRKKVKGMGRKSGRHRGGAELHELERSIEGEAAALRSDEPPPFFGLLIEALHAGAAAALLPVHSAACRALPLLPAGKDPGFTRAVLWLYWLRLAEAGEHGPRRIARLVAGFRDYLRRAGAAKLGPWRDVLARRCAWRPWNASFEVELLESLPDPARWSEAYELLGRAAAELEEGPSLGEALALVLLMRADPEAERVLRRGRAIGRRGSSVSAESIEAACLLEPESDEAFAEIAGSLHEAYEGERSRHEPAFQTGLRALARHGRSRLARALVLEKRLQDVEDLGLRLDYLRRVQGHEPGLPAPAPAPSGGTDDWVSFYPPALHPALRSLAAAVPDARDMADRLLGRWWPRSDTLHREIAALEKRAAEGSGPPHLQERLERLRGRLARPANVPAARVRKEADRLERALLRSELASVTSEIDERVQAELLRELGTDAPPEWLGRPELRRALILTRRLEPPERRLALRVLQARLGPPPWDLRDVPENRAFLDELRRRGIEPDPWLDGIGRVHAKGAGGRPLVLELEDDPLEILMMGEHFGTCLSLGSFNYFSVFANAADVNKRVLYARDARGQVVGRCLLALTAEGSMLTFHAYAHRGDDGLDVLVADFARTLASRMRTSPLPEGQVPRLLAPRWYDDGPRDLTGQFGFLKDGSDFRRELPELQAAALPQRLRELFAPLPLNELTLPLFVALPEVRHDPRLLMPLLPLLDSGKMVPLWQWLDLVAAAAADGDLPLARRLARQAQGRLRKLERGAYQAGVLAERLAAVDPSAALRLLKRTRPKPVRSWRDETDTQRLLAAAAAHEALGRPRRAAELRRRASLVHGR
jgi:hypothetical protein